VKRSALIVVVAGALVAAIVGPVYGTHAALVTAALVTGLSAVGLAAAHMFAGQRPLHRLQVRFDLVVGTAVGVILVTVVAAAELMFVSNHDALMVSAIALAAALVALRAARVASAGVVREVGALRDAVAAVGEGERQGRVEAGAAIELGELAGAMNRMIEQLAEEERRRDAADAARRTWLPRSLTTSARRLPRCGYVTVRAEPAGDWVEIEVADTGSGIPPAHRERLFEPFVRGAGNGESEVGAGLGLALCRAIVEAHGGRIWLADSETGTRVRFVIPT
jgi:signal transduction histidine kinase